MADAHFQRAQFDADLVYRALKDDDFRSRLMTNPTEVYAEELVKAMPGHDIPAGVEVRVAEEDENVFYVVLPCIPSEMHLSDEALRRVAEHEQTHRKPCWRLGDAPS